MDVVNFMEIEEDEKDLIISFALSLANSQSSRDGQLIKSLTVGLPMEVIQLNW